MFQDDRHLKFLVNFCYCSELTRLDKGMGRNANI